MTYKHSKSRRILRGAIRLFVLLSVIVMALGLFLTVRPGEAILRKWVQSRLSTLLGERVHLSGLETNLISRVQIKGLEIGTSDQSSLQAGLVSFHYSIWTLLTSGIRLDDLRIDTLSVTLIRDSTGWRLPDAVQPGQSSAVDPHEHISLPFDAVTIGNARIHYLDHEVDMEYHLNRIAFSLNREQKNTYSYQLLSHDGEFEYKGNMLSSNRLEIGGRLHPDILVLDSLIGSFHGIQLTATGRIPVNLSGPPLNAQIHLVCQLDSLPYRWYSDILPGTEPLRGLISLHSHCEGTITRPQFQGSISFPALVIQKLHLEHGEVQFNGTQNNIRLTDLSALLFQGKVYGTAEVDFDGRIPHKFRIHMENIPLDSLWSALHQESSPYKGKLSASLDSHGSLVNPENLSLHSYLKITEISNIREPLPDMTMILIMNHGEITFRLHQDRSQIRMNAHIDSSEIRGNFHASLQDLRSPAMLANIRELTGSVEIRGFFSKNGARLTANADFAGSGLRYQHFPVDTLQGCILFNGRHWLLESCSFAAGPATIDSTAPPFHIQSLGGAFTYHGRFSGPIRNPRGLFEVSLSNPVISPFLADTAYMSLYLNGRKAQLRSFMAERRNTTLLAKGEATAPTNGKGWRASVTMNTQTRTEESPEKTRDSNASSLHNQLKLGLENTEKNAWRISLIVDTLQIGSLSTFTPHSVNADGSLSLNLDAIFSDMKTRGKVSFLIQEPTLARARADSITGYIELQENLDMAARLDMYSGQHRSNLTAAIPFKVSGDKRIYPVFDESFSFHAEGDSLDLTGLASIFSLPYPVKGLARFQVQGSGTMLHPRLLGDITVAEGAFQLSPSTLPVTNIECALQIADTVLILESCRGTIAEIPLEIRGRIRPVSGHRFAGSAFLLVHDNRVAAIYGNIDSTQAEMRGEIDSLDLQILQPFAPNIRISGGTGYASFKIQKRPKQTSIQGNMRLENTAFQPNGFTQGFHDGILELSADSNKITIDSMKLQFGNGIVSIQGQFPIRKLGGDAVQMDVKIKDVDYNQEKLYSLSIRQADFQIRESEKELRCQGEIIMGKSELVKDFLPKDLLNLFRKGERPPSHPPQLLKNLRLQIRFAGGDKLWISNNIAQLRFHPELTISGPAVRPHITGRVTVPEGYIFYLDRKFTIEKGIMDFSDPYRINPVVNLQARAEIKSFQNAERRPYEITLKASGPMDKATISLSSEPPLSEPDIVTLLTLGATRQQITGTESGDLSRSDVFKDRAQVLSSHWLSGYASRRIGNWLQLDNMEVQGNLFGFGANWGPQLVASKKLSNRIEMSYSSTVGHLNEHSIRLNYLLSKNFSIQGQTNHLGQSGIDFKFQVRIK
jgi:hypothetical protein